MIRFLRRSRLLALALLLATPALGGAWLQAAHPCPIDAPWASEHGGGHGGHHTPGDGGSCHCVGSCAASAAAVLVAGTLLPRAAIEAPATSQVAPSALAAPALRPSDRLPPATAPPTLS